ncbi:erythromycin esterase [Stackebrandtia albiflava]|uniref:Erythromycin esterase n=1 Tax=Stackebrandtia albiflava TaxID=406432 RepID=A0A562URC8_9ACTN|nr:erythromycin esterase family protein [Stackebrandtia albiflava]TWJ08148.1 erythromycin esterase [Stackebrandtia albiflava]
MTDTREYETVEAQVVEWIGRTARPVRLTGGADDFADLSALGGIVGTARLVGLGETTRAGHEVMAAGARVLRYLVTVKGFRVLALQDDVSVIEEIDRYVRTGEGDLARSIADMWNPWRTVETTEIFEWLRAYNAAHPDDPVSVHGLTPPAARVAHYDRLVARFEAVAPDSVARLRTHLDPIRTAHDVNEHVQTAQGIHPGRPFADHARDALDLAEATGDREAVELAELILEFHAGSVAGGYDFDAAGVRAAEAVAALVAESAGGVLYWEGMAHTANAAHIRLTSMGRSLRGVGSRLRERFGDEYVSIQLGFSHGRIHQDTVPPPPVDFVDAVLNAGPTPYLLDLRAAAPEPVAAWLRRDHKVRIIAGIYHSEEDDGHFVSGGPFSEWFDAVLRVGEITPTTPAGR